MWWKRLKCVWGSLWKVLWNPGIKSLLTAQWDGMGRWMTWLYLLTAWGSDSTHMRFVSGHEITALNLHQEWLHKCRFWHLWKVGITWSNFPTIYWSLESEPWKSWNPGLWRKVRPQPGAAQGECPSCLVVTSRESSQAGLRIVLTAAQYPRLYMEWTYLLQVYGNGPLCPWWY